MKDKLVLTGIGQFDVVFADWDLVTLIYVRSRERENTWRGRRCHCTDEKRKARTWLRNVVDKSSRNDRRLVTAKF
jgi:hypothetical protein